MSVGQSGTQPSPRKTPAHEPQMTRKWEWISPSGEQQTVLSGTLPKAIMKAESDPGEDTDFPLRLLFRVSSVF